MGVSASRDARGMSSGRQGMPVVDTDVHAQALPDAIASRLPLRWREYVWGGRNAITLADLVRVRSFACRTDTWPPGGGIPASNAAFVAEQVLDRYDVDYGVLDMIAVGASGTGPKGYVEAVCAASNQWLAEEFLAADDRWLASANVPYEHGGDAVVRELERCAADKRFVQVILSMRTEKPLGDPKYWGMYEACEALGLPVAIHPATHGGNMVTGAGWPSYYFEDHVGYPQANPVHVASMIFEGVFDRFPGLKFVIVEGGWAWAPWLCARLDATWRVMGDEVPDLERTPSEYVHDHVWFTTQPIEEPEDPAHLPEVFAFSGFVDRVMFSSDYPHWDFDSPNDALPASLPRETRRKIFYETACDLYGLTVDTSGVEEFE